MPIRITKENISEQVRGVFSRKKRKPGGKRGSESKRIPQGADFIITITGPGKRVLQTDPLHLGAGADDVAIGKAIRNAVFGLLRADTDYHMIDAVHVTDEGELVIDFNDEHDEGEHSETWEIMIERHDDDEPLDPEFDFGDPAA